MPGPNNPQTQPNQQGTGSRSDQDRQQNQQPGKDQDRQGMSGGPRDANDPNAPDAPTKGAKRPGDRDAIDMDENRENDAGNQNREGGDDKETGAMNKPNAGRPGQQQHQ